MTDAIVEDLLKRVGVLEERVRELESTGSPQARATAKARGELGLPRRTDARWMAAVKFAPKTGVCATTRCKTKIAVGDRAFYAPKDCAEHPPGLYCATCGEAMAPAPVTA